MNSDPTAMAKFKQNREYVIPLVPGTTWARVTSATQMAVAEGRARCT